MIDTGKVRLPSLPRVNSGNPALDKWMNAVSERLEVREGSGNPFERVVLLRELTALGLDATQWGTKTGTSIAGVMVQNPNGQFSRVPLDAFADEIRKTRLYRDLTLAINDTARFEGVPDQVKSLLLESIADEAAKRGADIQRLDHKLQSATESLAYTVQEVTAAVQGAAAGVREVSYASATANNATAGRVTQVQARIDNVEINPTDILPTVYASLAALQAAVPVGVPGKFYQVTGTPVSLYRWTGSAYVLGGSGTTATVEQRMTATADRVQGALASYTIKLSTGGAVTGFGLSASEDPTGATTSDFIVQADRFSVVMPGYANVVPFSVDATGVHINSNVTINGTLDFSQVNGATKPANNATANQSDATTNAAIGSAATTAVWTSVSSRPTTLSTLNSTDGTKLSGIEAGATVGATSAQATIITRAETAINTSGVVVANVVPTALAGAGAGLRLGSDYMGYHNGTEWKTYMDNFGNFYLGGTSGALRWDGTTLTINGNGTFSGALSAATGSFAGTISAASLDTTGYVNAKGSTTVAGITYAGVFNSSLASTRGVYGEGKTGSQGIGVWGHVASGGGAGVWASSDGGGAPALLTTCLGGIAIHADQGQIKTSVATGTAPFDVTSTTVCTNLNAEMVNGLKSNVLAQQEATNPVSFSIKSTGSATATYVGTNKPGTASSNVWQKILINGAAHWLPVWPE